MPEIIFRADQGAGVRRIIRIMQGDTRSHIIRFVIPRYDSGVDLSGLAWYIHFIDANGVPDIELPSGLYEVTEEELRVRWMLTERLSEISGSTQFRLHGVNADSDGNRVVWISGAGEIEVVAVPGVDVQPSQNDAMENLDKLIVYVEGQLPNVLAAGDRAGVAADRANNAAGKANSAAAAANTAAARAEVLADDIESKRDLIVGKADAYRASSSGNPLTIYADRESPLHVETEMEPLQAGYGEPCMPGMGKNLMPPWEQGTVSGTNGADAPSSTIIRSGFAAVAPGTTYTVWRSIMGNAFAVRGYDADKNYIGAGDACITLVSGGTANNPISADRQRAVISPNDGVYFLRFIDYTNDLSGRFQLEVGDVVDVAYVPYDNERPISAPNPLSLTVGVNTYTRLADSSFYGGKMDWSTGKLTSEWGFIELNGSETGWSSGAGNFFIAVPGIVQAVSDLISNRFVNAPTASVNGMKANQMRQGATHSNVVFGNPNGLSRAEWLALLAAHPVQLAFRLENVTAHQLEPQDMPAVSGENILRTNGKEIRAEYNKSITKAFSEVERIDDAVVQQQVDTWLAKHPEATTTVQDGAITKAKIQPDLYPRLENPFLTPQMFGCVCDGSTDDTAGFQACINSAANQRLPVMISGSMYINGTITVPRGVSVSGVIYSEYYPKILVGPDCDDVVFDCVDVQNAFRDIWVQTSDGKYRDTLNAFDFHGNDDFNVDSELRNVTIAYVNKAVVVHGRNVKIEGGLISHCRYGVYYDFQANAGNGGPTSAGGTLRGLQVENVRFHGVGEEPAIEEFLDSAAICIRNNTRSNLTVRGCICDQGGTFIDGYATEALIENNFVECFNQPALLMEIPDAQEGETQIYHPNNMGSWTIVGNHFKGNDSGAAYGMAVSPPENLVRIVNYGRILFSGNKLGHCNGDAIYLKNVIESAFIGNTFVRLRMKKDGTPCAFTLEGVNVAISQNKSLEDNTISLCRGIADCDNVVQSSGNFTFGPSWNIRIVQNRQFYQLFTGKSGTESTLSLSSIPDGSFIVRRTDGRSIWHCMKEDTYISTPAMLNANHSAIDYMQVTRNADTGLLTFNIDRLNTEDNTWTTIAVDINVEVMF